MLPLPLLLFRLFMSLLIMEQCAGDSSESRKCLNLSSSSHQYTAAGERRFTTTQCTMSLSTLLWNEWTRIKETLTIKFMLLGHFGELQQASLESVLFLSYYFIYHIFSFNVQLSLHSVFNTHIRRYCSHPPPHLHYLPPSRPQSGQQRHPNTTYCVSKRLVLFNPYQVHMLIYCPTQPSGVFFIGQQIQWLELYFHLFDLFI